MLMDNKMNTYLLQLFLLSKRIKHNILNTIFPKCKYMQFSLQIWHS